MPRAAVPNTLVSGVEVEEEVGPAEGSPRRPPPLDPALHTAAWVRGRRPTHGADCDMWRVCAWVRVCVCTLQP